MWVTITSNTPLESISDVVRFLAVKISSIDIADVSILCSNMTFIEVRPHMTRQYHEQKDVRYNRQRRESVVGNGL